MSKNIFKVNRGDSFEFEFNVYADGKTAPLDANAAVYFGLMHPHQPIETAIILRGYTAADINEDGILLIQLSPSDTRRLAPGIYYYTIKLQRGGNLLAFNTGEPDEVRTLVDRTKFIINE